MLLQHIVATLDEELNRLGQLREIVSGLAGSSVAPLEAQGVPLLSVQTASEKPLQLPEAAEAAVTRIPARERRSRTARPKTQPEPRALTSSIPAAPVVVAAADVAKRIASARRSAEKLVEPTPAPGSLGSMIRALRLGANT